MTASDRSHEDRLAWILEHWRLHTRAIPAIAALTAVNAAIVVTYPFLFKRIIDGVGSTATPRDLAGYTLLLFAVGVAHFLAYATMQYVRAKLNLSFEFGVRVRAFESLTRMGPTFFARFRTGDLITRLMDDVTDKLSWYMCSGICRVFEALLIILVCVGWMLSISPKLTLIAAGPLPLLIVIFVFSAGKLHDRYDRVQQSISHLNEVLETCFSGVRVVKSFTAGDMQRAIAFRAIEENRQAEVRAVRWQTVMDTLWGNIWQLGIVAVLFAGGEMVLAGEITLGDLVAFDYFVLLLVWPMFDIGQFLVRGKLSAVSIDRVTELERFPPDVDQRRLAGAVARQPGDEPPPDFTAPTGEARPEEISLVDVTHRFPNSEDDALRDVSFAARASKLTALVGETGSGKSTVLALIPRLIEPVEGSVQYGGRDLRDVELVAYRQTLGYVPQESILLSGSVLENIRFGRGWVTDEDISLAVRISQLAKDLDEWPAGLETIVGSRGVRLSGGQKQRVALARAIAGRPAILLLDDCTAALDAATEDAVWCAIRQELPQTTVILVTHRPATLQRVDQIVVFERGRIVETGTFSQLNAAKTRFHELYVEWKLRDFVD